MFSINKKKSILRMQLISKFGSLIPLLTMEIKLMTVDVTLRFYAYYCKWGKYIIILNTVSIIGKDLLL